MKGAPLFTLTYLFHSFDSISCNILLAGYVKFGYLSYARQLFDKIPNKSHLSFTTMIMGLAQGGCWYDAIKLFKGMRVLGFVQNEMAMSSVISAYSHCVGLRNGHMLHAFVVKNGAQGFNVVLTNLVLVYCACSCLKDARALFDEMPDRNIVAWNIMLNGYSKGGFVDLAMDLFEKMPERDVVSWGTIIDCYVQVGKLNEALSLYRAMLRGGVGPNVVMIVDIISACGQVMALHDGQQFHGVSVKIGLDCYDFLQSTIIHFYAACRKINLACLQFELGSKDHLPSWNALISGLIRNGMVDHAREVFNEMPERDVISWSSMISGYSQTEQPHMALELYHEMIACRIKPNEITMVSVLSAIASLGILEEGRAAHEYMCNNSISLNDILSAAIVDMYAKCGSISTALEVFSQVRNKVSTVSPWNAIICGSAMHGHADLSLTLFSDLQTCKIKPDLITFIGVLTACCHAGLVEEGEHHFKSMKSVYNIDPNHKHYGCMVDLLGRAGRLEEAEDLIKSMPMKADVVIWGALLAASRIHGNVEVGERAAESLARAEPSHGPSRILLSNIYADAGKWDDAVSVRRTMQSQRLTRTPGYSGMVC